ncbi:hypothetical protein [Methylogaea oryzae]|uniref:hypothetical protein n=1 Tax=Methylogaea oryzae TaxID=1295382 RepID=UPI0012E1A32D|nr:hypothetical protein [Methylogaea oryzae]
MMQIETRDGSTQQVDPGSVITFPEGLTSFEDCKKFKLFHQQDANALSSTGSNPSILPK